MATKTSSSSGSRMMRNFTIDLPLRLRPIIPAEFPSAAPGTSVLSARPNNSSFGRPRSVASVEEAGGLAGGCCEQPRQHVERRDARQAADVALDQRLEVVAMPGSAPTRGGANERLGVAAGDYSFGELGDSAGDPPCQVSGTNPSGLSPTWYESSASMTSYDIEITRTAEKQLGRLPREHQADCSCSARSRERSPTPGLSQAERPRRALATVDSMTLQGRLSCRTTPFQRTRPGILSCLRDP